MELLGKCCKQFRPKCSWLLSQKSSTINVWQSAWWAPEDIPLWSKVPCVSVAISIARISTALFSKRFLRTNSSLQTIAAAPPSDSGLRKEESSANRPKGVPRPFVHSEKLAQVQKQRSLAWTNWKINFQKISIREICYFVNRRSKYHVQWFENLPTF